MSLAFALSIYSKDELLKISLKAFKYNYVI